MRYRCLPRKLFGTNVVVCCSHASYSPGCIVLHARRSTFHNFLAAGLKHTFCIRTVRYEKSEHACTIYKEVLHKLQLSPLRFPQSLLRRQRPLPFRPSDLLQCLELLLRIALGLCIVHQLIHQRSFPRRPRKVIRARRAKRRRLRHNRTNLSGDHPVQTLVDW